MNKEHVLFACQAGVCVFKFVGDLRHTDVQGMDSYVQSLFKPLKRCNAVSVDLSQTRYMDSTCLGLLAMIAKYSIAADSGKPALVCNNEDMLQLLRSMCLDQVFVMVKRSREQLNFQGLEGDTSDDMQARLIYQAHKALSDLSDSNKAMFQPVVDLMAEELKNSRK
ncbi:STAS domain-containing protein [Bowmanella denitrificans]|uniref:STAS domain-containing protein n=1 Tax=Bowmanella denitrificans TaxID=366582 RepID=UPI000C99AC07|nr:STAS domain-containing protein [Bowmanella denitrificans]